MSRDVKPLQVIKKENVVTQTLDFSCGAAGLSTLFNYYLNDPIPEDQIIAAMLQHVPLEKVQARHGFSLLDLKSFAQGMGYEVTGYQMDMDYLRELNKPLLVPIKYRNYRHFVVVRGVRGDRVFIADPAAGNMTMKLEQFQNIWLNGIGLLIDHPEDQHRPLTRLTLKEDDLMFVDYKLMTRVSNLINVRTAVHSGEF